MSSCLLNWNITNGCNLRCKHCAMANTYEKCDLDMKSNKLILKRLIDEHIIDTVVFSSLEPLKYDGIFELLRYCNFKGIATGIITNGTLLTPEIITELEKANLTYLAISIEGITPQSNDVVRGKYTFNSVMKAFKIINERYKKNKYRFLLSLEINIHKKNLSEIDDFIPFFNHMNFTVVNVGEISKIGRAKENDELIIDENDHELSINRLMFNYAKKRNGLYKLVVKSLMIYESIYYNVIYNISLLVTKPICPVSNCSGVSLSYDGKISACSFSGYDNHICASIKDIPNGFIKEKVYQLNKETQKMLIRSDTVSSDCNDCKYKGHCTICPIAYNEDLYIELINRCNKYKTKLVNLAYEIYNNNMPFYIIDGVYLYKNPYASNVISYINQDGSIISEIIPDELSQIIEYWFRKDIIYSNDNNGYLNAQDALIFLVINGFITIYGGNRNE